MIRFLSDIKPLNLIVVGIVLLGFRMFYLFRPDFLVPQPDFGETHIQYIFFLLNRNPYLSFVLSYILTFTTALTLNKIVNDQELLSQKTYLPAYFYCIFSSAFPEYILLTPVVFVNLLMAFAFQRIFEVYRASWPIDNIFLGGFLIGMCVLFSLSYLIFFPYLIIGIWFFRPAKLNEFLAALFGFLLPLFAGVVLNYLFNDIFLSKNLSLPNLSFSYSWSFLITPPIILFVLIVIVSTLKIAGNFWRNNIKNRRILLLLYVYTTVALILALTGKQNPIAESHFLSISLSVFTAIFFNLEGKYPLYKKILHGITIITILGYQFYPFWF